MLPKPAFEDVDRGFVFAEFAAAGSSSLPAQKAQQHAAAEKSTEPKTKIQKATLILPPLRPSPKVEAFHTAP